MSIGVVSAGVASGGTTSCFSTSGRIVERHNLHFGAVRGSLMLSSTLLGPCFDSLPLSFRYLFTPDLSHRHSCSEGFMLCSEYEEVVSNQIWLAH